MKPTKWARPATGDLFDLGRTDVALAELALAIVSELDRSALSAMQPLVAHHEASLPTAGAVGLSTAADGRVVVTSDSENHLAVVFQASRGSPIVHRILASPLPMDPRMVNVEQRPPSPLPRFVAWGSNPDLWTLANECIVAKATVCLAGDDLRKVTLQRAGGYVDATLGMLSSRGQRPRYVVLAASAEGHELDLAASLSIWNGPTLTKIRRIYRRAVDRV